MISHVLRSKFFVDMIKNYPHFHDLDDNFKIIFVFNNVDPIICRLTAAYIYLCVDYREALII